MADQAEKVGAIGYVGIILFDKFEELDAIGSSECRGKSRLLEIQYHRKVTKGNLLPSCMT